MDFASLMSKEISKKRPTSASDSPNPAKKYQKRSEVESDRRAAYSAEQKALQDAREAKLVAKRKADEEADEEKARIEEKRRRLAEESRRRREESERAEEAARRKRLGLPDMVEQNEQEEILDDDVPDEELVEKLREMGEPAKLFGESHKARLKRWRKLGIVMTTGPIPTSLELVDEKDMKVGKVPDEADAEGRKWLFRQLASYFTMVLKEWEEALEREGRGDSFASKAAFGAMVQSKENMTPVSRTRAQSLVYN